MANRHVRVFRINRWVVGSRIYYACDLRRRRARFIDRTDDDQGLQRLALSGWRVAFEYAVCDDPESGGCEHALYRFDVRRRRPRFVASMPFDAAFASDLVITRTGAMAWILGTVTGVQLWVADSAGPRVLTADRVERGSLAVAGRRIYWMSGGEARSARLD